MLNLLLPKDIGISVEDLEVLIKLYFYERHHSHPLIENGFIIEEYEGIASWIFEIVIPEYERIYDLADIRIQERGASFALILDFGEEYERDYCGY